MKKREFGYLQILAKRLLIVLLLYSICRILFYLFNRDLYPFLGIAEFGGIMIRGIRFDLSAILYVNLIFILLHLIPHPWRGAGIYRVITKAVFYIFNGIALALELADFSYFRYSLQRSTTHLLSFSNDLGGLIPRFIRDFWYLFILFFLLIAAVEFLYRRTRSISNFKINYPIQIFILVLAMGLWFLGARGGWQLKPISPGTAALYVSDNRLSPLVINTPFNIIYSINHRGLEKRSFFTDQEAISNYPIYHNINPINQSIEDDTPNVIILVLESFSREYLGYYDAYKGFTPFLDSLMEHSLVFANTFANGIHSNEGIIAITASIPSLMDDPFIYSLYQNNSFRGNASLLSDMGYQTAFFHGGHNGTMGFDQYIKSAGFDQYFGKNEYNNDSDYDGTWGIYDEPFLQWSAEQLNDLEEPFHSLLFTLSNHHPFTIPDEYKEKLPQGEIDILETVAYTDFALKRFFAKISGEPWFENTLFVITADHTGPWGAQFPEYSNPLGWFKIPMFFYHPGDSTLHGRNDRIAQHTDIMPTILSYVNYTGKYVAFGRNLLDTEIRNNIAFNYVNGAYRFMNDSLMIEFDGDKPIGLFRYKEDKLLTQDLLYSGIPGEEKLYKMSKSILQVYTNAMIDNKLLPE